jgi:hypothetical protein
MHARAGMRYVSDDLVVAGSADSARVANSSDPRPCCVGVRSTHRVRVSLAACDRAVPGCHPSAHPHASIGAGSWSAHHDLDEWSAGR